MPAISAPRQRFTPMSGRKRGVFEYETDESFWLHESDSQMCVDRRMYVVRGQFPTSVRLRCLRASFLTSGMLLYRELSAFHIRDLLLVEYTDGTPDFLRWPCVRCRERFDWLVGGWCPMHCPRCSPPPPSSSTCRVCQWREGVLDVDGVCRVCSFQ